MSAAPRRSYLVTGGTGFIGARVARALLARGDEVVAYDALPQEDLVERVLPGELRARLRVVAGDVLDLARLLDTAKRHRVDTVIHLAYLLAPASSANPRLAVRVNCEGTLNALEAVRLLELRRLVWTSSAGVFGPAHRYPTKVLPNDAPHFPIYVYGACKSLNETVATHYFDALGVDSVGLRLTFIYGPGIRRGGGAELVSALVDKPARGEASVVPYGDDTLNLLHVDEAARLLVMAADAPRTRTRVFNTSGEVTRVRDAAALVSALVPGADLTVQPGVYMGAGVTPWYDTTSLVQEIGFEPRYGLKEGLRLSIEEARRSFTRRGCE